MKHILTTVLLILLGFSLAALSATMVKLAPRFSWWMARALENALDGRSRAAHHKEAV